MSDSLYDDLVAAGAELDNHESDLYVKANPETAGVIMRHGRSLHPFRSRVDGLTWYEVPFAFAPFWRKRGGA